MEPDERYRSNGAKRKGPWELWATYKFQRTERTWKVRSYATEQMADDAGKMLLRKHPTFYVRYEVKFR